MLLFIYLLIVVVIVLKIRHLDRVDICFCHYLSLYAFIYLFIDGARCSSVVRSFAHDAMGCRVDPSWCTHRAISRSSQCSTTGITKTVVSVILSVG